MTASQPIILWDIDGTLLAAGDGGLEHYHRAISAVAGEPRQPAIDTHGKTDWQVILEMLAADGLDAGIAPAVSAELDRLSDVFLADSRLTLLPDVAATLGRLREAGIRNGLLTGNSEMRSRHKLGGAGLDLALFDWDVCFFGSRSPVRPHLTTSARERHPEGSLLIVGDTPFDGTAAAAARIPFLAVCTGKYGREAFAGSDAVAVIDTLAQGYDTIVKAARQERSPAPVGAA